MTVRVRFAPSPTGPLHIGGLRTALYNYLLARANGGKFILRVEDTDRERSRSQYEEEQREALVWAGVNWDEGPGKEEGSSQGPYRQSERLPFYQKYADQLIEDGKAFYCFCTEEELAEIKEQAIRENRPPHYDGRYRHYPKAQALQRINAGERPVVRFKVPMKSYVLQDLVRGRVVFPENMVGDFVIMRSNGLPVYNFCCVVDDWLMRITHVVRGEDHLSNTIRQLMLYEALGESPPQFAHVSLLIGQDRQKLSKRQGAVSVDYYRQQGLLPQALTNYLCLLGWSHPEGKDIFQLEEIASIFETGRLTKASAIYDVEKLKYINGQHLRQLSDQDLFGQCRQALNEGEDEGHPFYQQSEEWQRQCLDLFKQQIHVISELPPLLDDLFRTDRAEDKECEEILNWQTTPPILNYLKGDIEGLVVKGQTFASEGDFNKWVEYIKKTLKIKGKFLFKGMRAVLTGKGHGPELKDIIPLTPLLVLKQRIENLLGP